MEEVDNMMNPKLLTTRALMLLEEAVLTVLFHEPNLKPSEISTRLGIEKDDYTYLDRSYPIVRSVLIKLQKDGRVEPDAHKRAKWKLTKNENSERQNTLDR